MPKHMIVAYDDRQLVARIIGYFRPQLTDHALCRGACRTELADGYRVSHFDCA